MGKGGGGGQPTSTTAYQTNLPEYAKPYVMNMLGAAQNQLFTTTPGKDGEPGEITGFKPYTPYSTDPTKYFAGPTGLQQQVYGEAAGMQTPGAYGAAQGMAGAAGLGQFGTAQQAGRLGQMGLAGAMPAFGAGQQYASQVTDPNAVSQYMSPYMQNVVDTQKAAAVREAQIANQAQNLASARSGTYGGARQALASAERERGLLSNLANIQAQGSQNAYNQALQNMQYGANLGLQGISTGLQGVSTGLQGLGAQQAGYAGAGSQAQNLANIANTQQQADLARMGFQQQTGAAQQQYQQNIINQAIQDYATAQQYPYMQLSTMSNLLRGLPMQSMSTQQYQAQAPMAQQAAGLLGAYGAYKGAFKEGGAVVPGYKSGVLARVDNTLDDLADAGGIGALKKRLAETNSPKLREEIQDKISELSGIARANVGDLGRNMAGGGIIAFNGEAGSQVELSDEEKKALEENAYLRRSRAVKDALAPLGQLRNYDPVQKLADLGGGLRKSWTNFITEKPEDQAKKFRSYSNRTEQAANPDAYVPAVKTASQRQEDAEAADTLANVGRSKIDYNKADQLLKASKNVDSGDGAGPSTGGAASGAGGKGGYGGYGLTGGDKMGIDDAFAKVLKLTGQDQTPQEMADYLNMLKEKSGKVGELSAEAGRFNKALAFLEAGQDPRGLLAGAITGGKSYLAGEAANRDKFQKMELDYAKAQSDYRKAEIERAKGNFDTAEKLFDKAKDREKDIIVAQMQMNKPGEFEKMYAVYAADEKAAGRTPSFEGFKRSSTFSDETSKLQAVVKADTVLANDMNYLQLANSKKPEDRQKAAQIRQSKVEEYISYLSGGQQTASAGGGNRLRFDASGKQI